MTRRLVMRGCALLLLWQMVPGTLEVVDHAVHLLTEGQLATRSPQSAPRSCDAERDCSGPVHCCPCHTGSFFVIADQRLSVPPTATVSRRGSAPDEAPRRGHRARIFRPPTA